MSKEISSNILNLFMAVVLLLSSFTSASMKIEMASINLSMNDSHHVSIQQECNSTNKHTENTFHRMNSELEKMGCDESNVIHCMSVCSSIYATLNTSSLPLYQGYPDIGLSVFHITLLPAFPNSLFRPPIV